MNPKFVSLKTIAVAFMVAAVFAAGISGCSPSEVRTNLPESSLNLVESAEHSTAPTEPSTESAESSTASAEPSTESAESSTAPAEPSTASAESSTAPAEPSTASAEHSTVQTEPSTESAESSTASAEPSTESAESSTAPAEPSTASAEPSTASAEPSTASAEHSTAPAEPSTTLAEHSTASETYLYEGVVIKKVADCRLVPGDKVNIEEIYFDPENIFPVQLKTDRGCLTPDEVKITPPKNLYGVGIAINRVSDLHLEAGNLVEIVNLLYSADSPRQYKIISDDPSGFSFVGTQDIVLLSPMNEFLGTETYGVLRDEGAWVHVLFEHDDSYTIQWGFDLKEIPKESVSISDSHPAWEYAMTEGMITPGPVGITANLDPYTMKNGQYAGQYVELTEKLHVLGCSVSIDPGTFLLIWGEYDENWLIVCWYDQYMIVPKNSINLNNCWSRNNLHEDSISAGYMYDPLVLPATDILWSMSPTKNVEVTEETEAFLHGLPRESRILSVGETFEAFDLTQSPTRWYAWDNVRKSLIFIPKNSTITVNDPIA